MSRRGQRGQHVVMDESVELVALGGQRPVHGRGCFAGVGRLSQIVGPASGLEHAQGDGSMPRATAAMAKAAAGANSPSEIAVLRSAEPPALVGRNTAKRKPRTARYAVPQ